MLFLAAFVFLLTACYSPVAASTQPAKTIRVPVIEASGLRFTHIDFAEGASHGRVAQIIQDDQGFMWFGTNSGFERYDGYTLRSFRHDPGNPNTLSGSTVNVLFKDRSGKLWIGSDDCLDRFDPISEVFRHYPLAGTPFEGVVTHISEDREGTIWVSTDKGLNRLDPVTGRMLHFQHRPGDPTSLADDVITATLETSDGTFWVGGPQEVAIFDQNTGEVIRHLPLPRGGTAAPTSQLSVSLFQDHEGVLWVTSRGGLAAVDRSTYELTYYVFQGIDSDRTPLTGVRPILEDKDGTLWLGGANTGIFKLDRDRKEFIHYRNNPSDTYSLSTDQVVALCQDREGNIWVGTTGGGVNRFSPNPLPFRRYRYEPWNPNSLPSNYTSSVFEDSHGNLWVGSIDALTKIDRRSGQFTFFHSATGPGGLSSSWVLSIAEDRSGYLWFGTIGKGLDRFDPRSGQFKVYAHDPADIHSLDDDTVFGLLVDRKGTLWAATGAGVDAFDAKTGSFHSYRMPGETTRYSAIAEDSNGALWLATRVAGLRRLDPVTGKFTVYRQSSGGLSSNQVNTVCVDRSGIVWAGTQNGLDRLDPISGKFTVYYERDGLPSSSVQNVLQDGHGDLWLSTSNGISHFSPSTQTFSNYYVSDGLLGNEFYNYAGAYESPAGEMFFNSYAGVISFFPDKVVAMDRPYTPPVVLTDFQLFSKPVSIGEQSPLKQAISFTRSLVLSNKQSIFSFGFAALSYSDPLRSVYRYRLEGLESDWNETDSSHRFATYTTLPPGYYVLHVEGRTNRGPWSQAGASVHIRILPPWWSTWWFRAFCALVAIATLGALYELRLRQLSTQFNMRLDERVSERTRIARELHDTLLQSFHGLMLLFQHVRNLLPERPLEAMAALDDALVRADQAVTEGREAVHDLRASAVGQNDLARAMTALGEELGAAGNGNASEVKFRVVIEGTPRNLHPILRDEVYCIAREALRNAYHHAHASQIEAEICYGATLFRLRIRDDGSGIDPKVLQQGGRTGHWGLPGMHERTEHIGAQLGVWSRPGLGTEVDLSIPAAIAYQASPAPNGSRVFRRKAETKS